MPDFDQNRSAPSGSGYIHDYGGVWGNVNSGAGTQYNFHGEVIYVNLEAARKVAQHQPRRDPATAIGRTTELTALSRELEQHPCVVITGVGGIGKSTLAAMLGADQAAYTHRLWRNLSENATDFSAFIQAALATLGLSFDAREMPQPAEQAEYLAQILHDNPSVRLLIVLDNFESVINHEDDNDDLALGWADLLDRSAHNFGNSRLLITSRELPHLPQGQEPHRFSLPGLGLADGLALLQQFGVVADPADLEAAITRSGGHPLALRFLADLVQNEGYTVAQLLSEPIWDERTSERLLDKIYQALPLAQQQTLSYFSLFERPTTPATIAGTLANLPDLPKGWDEKSVRRAASALATRSLLDNNAGRYTTHPIVRTYAYAKLTSPAVYHRAAASYFRSLYTRDPHTNPPQQLEDVQSLLDAFDQLIAAGNSEQASLILLERSIEYMSSGYGISLNDLLDRWGEYARVVAMCKAVTVDSQGNLSTDSRSRVIGNLALAYTKLGRYDQAIDAFEETIAGFHETGNLEDEGIAMGNMGIVYYELEEYQQAAECFKVGLDVAESMGSLHSKLLNLGNLGNVYNSLRRYKKAIGYHRQAISIADTIGDAESKGQYLENLGNAYANSGDYRKARRYHQQALSIAEQIGDVGVQSSLWRNIGIVCLHLKQHQYALVCYYKAMHIRERIGNPQELAQINHDIAALRATVGETDWPALEAEAKLLAADPAWRPALPKDEDTP